MHRIDGESKSGGEKTAIAKAGGARDDDASGFWLSDAAFCNFEGTADAPRLLALN